MNLQQAVQPRSSSNGFGRRRVERETATRLENKLPSGKINPSKTTHAGLLTGSKGGECESPSRNRLVYLTTCLIGHHVDVQVKNGSIYSGIFRATNAKNDFGIILKMARLTKDGSFRGQKSNADSVGNVPSKTFIIPATDLVQVIAKEEAHPSQLNLGRDLYQSGSNDMASSFPAFDGESRILENQFSEQHGENNSPKEFVEKQMLAEEAQTTKSDDSTSSLNAKKDGSDKMGLSPNATAYAPSRVPIQENITSPSELLEPTVSGKAPGETQNSNSRGHLGSSTSSTSECIGFSSASTVPALSPSSSMGSLSSEKSTLNPNAKEFKLNPNAKSFTPTQTTARPPSPVTDGSFYYPGNVSTAPHMHGMPVNIGIGPSFPGHLFNPQAAPVQSPQAYFHPNAPQFGQQMILGHPRQVVYMPSYPPEMPYRGRDY